MSLYKRVAVAIGIISAGLFPAAEGYGYGYQANDWVFSVGAISAPVELGSDWGEINVEAIEPGIAHDSKLGEPGLGLDLQALYFVHPHIAVGADISQIWFLPERSSGWWVDGKTSQQRYLAAARVYVNPQSRTRVYASLGAGVAHSKISIELSPTEDFEYTGFAYYAGLGVERSINEHWSLGWELRYNGNKFHDEKQIASGDHMALYRQANYISSVLRVNYQI